MFYDSQLLEAGLNQHSFLVLGFAFIGGVTSSFLPCTISMMPVLLGYIGGYGQTRKMDIFIQATLFIIGLSLVLTVMGILASLLGVTFGTLLGSWFYYLIGLISIAMALNLLGYLTLPLPKILQKLPQRKTGFLWAPLFLGISYGLVSSPCGTPFLSVILSFISQEKNWILGGLSLFCYGLGQGALLLVLAMFTGMLKHLAVLRRVGSIITKLSAGLFLLTGLMLLAQGAGWLYPLLSAIGVLPQVK
jgi:cytochrome c-type biogenesis protein